MGTSLRKLRNNIGVIDYLAGDNEMCEQAKQRCSKGYRYRRKRYRPTSSLTLTAATYQPPGGPQTCFCGSTYTARYTCIVRWFTNKIKCCNKVANFSLKQIKNRPKSAYVVGENFQLHLSRRSTQWMFFCHFLCVALV